MVYALDRINIKKGLAFRNNNDTETWLTANGLGLASDLTRYNYAF
jgi:hypothetical protein